MFLISSIVFKKKLCYFFLILCENIFYFEFFDNFILNVY